jgi:hypothetical protein
LKSFISRVLPQSGHVAPCFCSFAPASAMLLPTSPMDRLLCISKVLRAKWNLEKYLYTNDLSFYKVFGKSYISIQKNAHVNAYSPTIFPQYGKL